jgi:hypothetical protein
MLIYYEYITALWPVKATPLMHTLERISGKHFELR